METNLFTSELWSPALTKFGEATGFTVVLFDAERRSVLATPPTPLVALFREYDSDPGLFAECAARCVDQTSVRPVVFQQESHGLAVVGTSLMLEGRIVGAAVAGYALAQFSQVAAVQRWARSVGIPFEQLWNVVRRHPPAPERRLRLHGELLQVLGDALLRENYRSRQYEDTAVQLRAASTAKDEFIAVLSHELRTPLAAILTWASVLKIDQRPESVRRAAEVITQSVALQKTMIEDLLDVNRIAHGTIDLKVGVHDLRAVVDAAVEMSGSGTDQHAAVQLVGSSDPLFVRGDAGRLQQIVRNVVSNAIKFTPPDGRVGVALERQGSTAIVVVTDSGVGIAPEFLPFVFEMFRQQEGGTRRSHSGLGIGLALVKRLVELHHGTVEIQSAGAGCGTTVTIRLPRVPADLPKEPLAESVSPVSPLSGLAILVVDDTDAVREGLKFLLESLGAEVVSARDGREALDLLPSIDPDLVLCDLRMPRLDGYEFLEALRRNSSSSSPPVVAISALASEEDRQRTRAAGFKGHVTKPFNDAEIIAAVSEALRHRPSRRLHS